MNTPGQDPHLRIGIEIDADTTGAKQAERAVDDVQKKTKNANADALKALEKIDAAERKRAETVSKVGNSSARIYGKTAAAAKGLSSEAGKLASSTSGAAAAMGALDAASSGANVSITTAAGGVAGFLQVIGQSLGPVSLITAAVGGVGVAIVNMVKRAKEAEVEKIFDDINKSREKVQQGLATLKEESEKSLKAQIDEVQKLAAAWRNLVDAQQEAQSRGEATIAAQTQLARSQLDLEEQTALSRAGSPEERERIKSTFARRRSDFNDRVTQSGFENRRLGASLAEETAQRTINAATEQRRAAETQLIELQQRRDQARFNTQAAFQAIGPIREELAALPSRADSNFSDLLKRIPLEQKLKNAQETLQSSRSEFKLAEAALENGLKNVQTVRIETDAVITEANQAITNARGSRDVANIDEAAFNTGRRAGIVGDRASLEAAAREAAGRGDFAAQDRAVAALRDLSNSEGSLGGGRQGSSFAAATRAQKEATSSVIILTDEIVENANAQTQAARKASARLKDLRP